VTSSKVIRSYASSFEGAYLHAKQQIRAAVLGFGRQFSRGAGGVIEDPRFIAGYLFREVLLELTTPSD